MGDRFCGFDLDRVAALQQAVAATAEPARTLSRHIGATSDTAMEVIARGSGISLHNLGVEPSMDTDPDRAGLRPVTLHAPEVAAEIGRRLAHLKACEKLAHDGFRIDPAAVFDDEPPPDETKIRAAVKQLRSALGQGDLDTAFDALAEADGAIVGLNRAETEAFVGELGAADLQKWNLLLSLHVFGMGLSNDSRMALANSLLSKLSETSVRSLVESLPALEPSFADTEGAGNDDQKDLHWKWADGGLGDPTLDDINQGDLGDCWFLASLGSELTADPRFLQKHVHDNGNGTYTVTFYDDGKPVPVTVDGRLPYNSWDQTAFEHPGNNENWVAIYEKAFAQYKGGYKNIEGGWGSEGMQDLTGRKSAKVLPAFLSPELLQKQLADGKPLTAGTGSHHSGFLWLHSDEYFDDHKLVTKHEYTVTSVNADADPPTVTVRNPWGDTGAVPETVTMSWDEFRDHFEEVSLGG
ncbi:MAG TPA: C2 family cysteine protease [Jatrophihabitans sp.]|nr:C2 family cysteine protease [Jatrophihabitans sp.]